jgi:hypothetical protein
LSLECRASVKDEIVSHGVDLGEWSLIATIRRAVRRSEALLLLARRGSLKLVRDSDGGTEDVKVE